MDAQHAAESWMGQVVCQTGGRRLISQYCGAVSASVQLSHFRLWVSLITQLQTMQWVKQAHPLHFLGLSYAQWQMELVYHCGCAVAEAVDSRLSSARYPFALGNIGYPIWSRKQTRERADIFEGV